MRLLHLVLASAVAATAVAPATGHAQLSPIQEGRRAWLKLNCYGCHGNNGGGGMGPNIQHAERGDVSQAMNGDASEGGMRSFAGIAKAADPGNIAAYLATIGTKNEPTWLDWWKPVP